MRVVLKAGLAVAAGFAALASGDPAQASSFKVLHAFSFSDIGYIPTGDLALDAAGNIFGTTAIGNQSGTIFQYALSTEAFQYLFSFNGAGDGAKPQGSLVLKDGGLYGTAASGGANNAGTVYRLDLASDALTTLHTFTGAEDGASPYGGLMLRKGEFYGAALQAGPLNGGVLYKIQRLSSKLTPLHTFDSKGENSPIGNVVLDSEGIVYGVNELNGKTSTGAIYAYDPATATFTILHAFDDKKMGAVPFAGVALFEGALYGTTYRGGQHNFGTVWKYDLATKTFTLLHSFAGTADGEQPQGRPAITRGGLLYGTAYSGGTYNYGTVFRIDLRTSKFKVLHDFQDSDGQYPEAGIALGKNGAIYGTAGLGGDGGGGTLFSITP